MLSNFFEGQNFPTADWANLLKWSYWTESFIGPTSPYTLFAIGLVFAYALLVILLGIKLNRLNSKTPIYGWIRSHLYNSLLFVVVSSTFYWFFRSLEIAYLSSRISMLVIILTLVAWLLYVLIVARRRLSRERSRYLERERFFRYLPKSGRNRT